jgi:ankyrin repeat protein
MIIATTDSRAEAATNAIRTGDTTSLNTLIETYPELPSSYVGDETEARSLLHILADWPGNHPNNCETAKILITAGANVNAPFIGEAHSETPLHWAASNNDVALIDTLLDNGANINAEGGVIDKTALADARAFLQLEAAHRLIARGASTTLQDLATLGMLEQVKSHHQESRPTEQETNGALWNACHGGQLATAKFLYEMGGDCHFVPPWDDVTPMGAAERRSAVDVVEWLRGLAFNAKG